MTKRSDIHFQLGVSLLDFQNKYGTEDQCRNKLFGLKWPKGYHCPCCAHNRYYLFESRSLYQCCSCRYQTSLLSGTIFAILKMSLNILFF
jgi:hypothetical protein